MKIAVRGGHNSQAIGAIGLLNEYVEDRKVCSAVVKYLNQMGHSARDVSPGPMGISPDLVYGVSQASNMGADLFISIHFNNSYDSYNGAIGTEAYVHSANRNSTDGQIATRIVNSLADAGFRNRGVKSNDGLYEMHKTKAYGITAVLIEVCFVEATEDVALYNKLGADHIGRLIAQAIVNQTTSTTSNSTNSNSSSSQNSGGEYLINSYPENGEATVVCSSLNVRSGHTTEVNNVVAQYSCNESFYYDYVYITNKYVYCSYVSRSGSRRFVAVKDRVTGKRFANCV